MQTGDTGRLARKHGCDLRLELVHGALDQWLAMANGRRIHRQPLFKERSTVDHEVGITDQPVGVLL